MLILANGAFKSGSTWLREIVRNIRAFDPIPTPFQHPDYSHWLHPRKIPEFVTAVDCGARHYLSKSHIYDPAIRDFLLSQQPVRILNIERDIRDVLVSHYFHLLRMKKATGDFDKYYWQVGRLKALQIWQYHEVWSVQSARLYTTGFERLKTEFQDEVQRIGGFVGVHLTSDAVARIHERTSLERLRADRGETEQPESKRFFRKGEIGEWQEYFDPNMLADLNALQTHRLGVAESIKFKLAFDFRPRLKRFFLGRSKAVSTLLARW